MLKSRFVDEMFVRIRRDTHPRVSAFANAFSTDTPEGCPYNY